MAPKFEFNVDYSWQPQKRITKTSANRCSIIQVREGINFVLRLILQFNVKRARALVRYYNMRV